MAIEADKRQITRGLDLFERALLEQMQPVAEKGHQAKDRALETRDRALEVRDQATQGLERARYQFARVAYWEEWVHDHPWETVGIGLALGFAVGAFWVD